jgi:uncharacterized protein
MILGDARTGKLADNLVAFGRSLRRAGLPIDASRIALAQEAAMQVGLEHKGDFKAALETVLTSTHAHQSLFNELFDLFFKDPELANKLLSQLLPQVSGKAPPKSKRPRVAQALNPKREAQEKQRVEDSQIKLDAAMTASDLDRIRHADFNQLSTGEFALVERLASQLLFALPTYASRRTKLGATGTTPDWPSYFRELTQIGDDALPQRMRERQQKPLPLVVLVDVSGSMERYARMMLSFLHTATAQLSQRKVFAFGTRLTDLSVAFKHSDPDLMLGVASQAIGDFAGGTRLGDSLATLRHEHARALVGRRTLVMLISDGLDTGEPEQLSEQLDWLKRHCGQLLWLNPLLRFDGYTPSARGPAQLFTKVDRMLAVHNLERLEQLADSIQSLISKKRIRN